MVQTFEVKFKIDTRISLRKINIYRVVQPQGGGGVVAIIGTKREDFVPVYQGAKMQIISRTMNPLIDYIYISTRTWIRSLTMNL
jgi:hypothetical protein